MYFFVAENRENGTFTLCILQMPRPGQRPTLFWCHIFTFRARYWRWRHFFWRPRNAYDENRKAGL